MMFTLRALFDEQTRKELRDAVLGEAKTVARNEIDAAIRDEVKRIGADIGSRLRDATDWRVKNMLVEAVQQVLTPAYWRDNQIGVLFEEVLQRVLHQRLGKLTEQMVKDATDKAVAEKLRTKTVWEASSQDAYVRKVVRDELRKMMKDD